MAISGLSTYQIIRYKDLTLGDTYMYYYNATRTMPDNMLISSKMLSPTTATSQVYTFIGPSTPYPNNYQCVTSDMFGSGEITGWTINLNVTMYGNVYLKGLSETSKSGATTANYIYLLPSDMTTHMEINDYISTYSANTNYDLFAISGSSTNVVDTTFINYSELNQSFTEENKFRQKYLSKTTATQDVVNGEVLGYNFIDGFKIGTIPQNDPCTFSFNLSGSIVNQSLNTGVYLVQYTSTIQNLTRTYGNPGISNSNTANTYSIPTSLYAGFMIPIGVIKHGTLDEVKAFKTIITRDDRSVENKYFTRTIDITIISPRFTLSDEPNW